MRTFVIGDIHGTYKALLQCFDRSGFDGLADRLIVLGDVCDVYPDVKECIQALLSLSYCDYLLGNHDAWTMEWSLRGVAPSMWLKQGGEATIQSYNNGPIPQNHFNLLNNSRLWLECEGRLFVHAGFDPKVPLKEQSMQKLTTDRTMIDEVWQAKIADKSPKIGDYKDIFIGHTPTQVFHSDEPLHLGNIWMMDTGAGWMGRLSIMDVETKQFWQSDCVADLYGSIRAPRSL